MTILDNIKLGKDCSFEEVQETAKMAFAHDFIMKLPQVNNNSICLYFESGPDSDVIT